MYSSNYTKAVQSEASDAGKSLVNEFIWLKEIKFWSCSMQDPSPYKASITNILYYQLKMKCGDLSLFYQGMPATILLHQCPVEDQSVFSHPKEFEVSEEFNQSILLGGPRKVLTALMGSLLNSLVICLLLHLWLYMSLYVA